ncbi:MAG: LuxR C-terminal-related transcriptional regulator [Deinococcota bacterium]
MTAATPLLVTKFHQPQPRASQVVREHLNTRLASHMDVAGAVALVVAPAGFGKTSLVSGFLANSTMPHGWLSLDENDNDPLRFWRYLLASIARITPEAVQNAQALLQMPQMPDLELLVTLLINDLSEQADPLMIVLDDYHLIEENAIHASISFLIEHLPVQCHVLLMSRSTPPLPLARLRAKGQLLELEQDDLRFSDHEARRFLHDVMQLELDPAEVDQLEHSTEGWVAGLQMAALALQGNTHANNAVSALQAGERYMLDYLVEEVLQQQTPDVQTFLLETSVLTQFSTELCDQLLARTDSRVVLEQVERANLFIVPLDDKRTWYRYHHLFAELLRHQLERRSPGTAARLEAAAGDVYLAQDEIETAFAYYLQAGLAERAATVLTDYAEEALGYGNVASLIRNIAKLPRELVEQQPRLLLAQAWQHVFQGELMLVPAVTTRARQALEQASLNAYEQRKLEGEILALSVFLERQPGKDAQQKMIQATRQALSQLDVNSFVYVTLQMLLAGIHFSLDNWHQALDIYQQAAVNSRHNGSIFGEVAAESVRSDIARLVGRLHDAHQSSLALLSRLSSEEQRCPYVGLLYVRLAQIEREWGNLTQAAHYAQTGFDLAKSVGDASSMLDAQLTLCFINLDQAEADNAKTRLASLREDPLVIAARDTSLNERITAIEIWLSQQAAPAWVNLHEARYQQSPSSKLDYLIFAYALLWAGRYQDAALFAQKNADYAWQRGHLSRYIAFGVVTVCAYVQLGNDRQACEVLQTLLEVAAPEGFIMSFVHGGLPLQRVLQQLTLTDPTLQSYQTQILDALQDHHGDASVRLPRGLLEPLSEREETVLRYLLAGLSNKRIAQELDVSVNTIKTHTRNIYGKFGVHGRMELVTRVQELGFSV